MVISVSGSMEVLYKNEFFSAIASLSGIQPGIGAYWLRFPFIAFDTS
jgi:hypothetical protein